MKEGRQSFHEDEDGDGERGPSGEDCVENERVDVRTAHSTQRNCHHHCPQDLVVVKGKIIHLITVSHDLQKHNAGRKRYV